MSIQTQNKLVTVPALNFKATLDVFNAKTSENRAVAVVQKIVFVALAAFVAIAETLLNAVLLPIYGSAKMINALNNRFAKKEVVDLTKPPLAIEVAKKEEPVVAAPVEPVAAPQPEEPVAAPRTEETGVVPRTEEAVVGAAATAPATAPDAETSGLSELPLFNEDDLVVATAAQALAQIPTPRASTAKQIAKIAIPAALALAGAAAAYYYLTSAVSLPVCTLANAPSPFLSYITSLAK